MSVDSLEVGRFGHVDTTGQADRFVAFLDLCERLPQMPELRDRSHEVLRTDTGSAVVDVGCGTGTATRQLTEHGVTATGIDPSEHLINVARERHPGVRFEVGTAQNLQFANASLDGYRAERVYQHLTDPEIALTEARRVLRPGGRIVLLDADADLWTVDAADRGVTRALASAFADTIASPWSGRRHRNLLLDAGFVDVEVELHPITYTDYGPVEVMLGSIAQAGLAAGAVSQEQADAWLADQRDRAERGRCYVLVPMFLASGTAPGL
jgi:ubiquinone/menaquinone biosynthesis C-methylase UbiE